MRRMVRRSINGAGCDTLVIGSQFVDGAVLARTATGLLFEQVTFFSDKGLRQIEQQWTQSGIEDELVKDREGEEDD